MLCLSENMSSTANTKSVPKKIQSKRRSKKDSIESLEGSQNSQSSKSRSKNFSVEESAVLIKCCDKFHPIISKNSSRDKDKNEKQQAWKTIARDFNHYCQSQGISFIDRSIDSLQMKYRQLKKMARKEVSEAKRDLIQTGNKQLRSRTVETLRDTNVLMELRSRMGVSATGFQSKHCSDANQPPILERLRGEINTDQDNENGNAVPSTSSYVPADFRKRKRTEYPGSVDSTTLVLGVESDNPSGDFSSDEDDDYERSNSSSTSTIDPSDIFKNTKPGKKNAAQKKIYRTDYDLTSTMNMSPSFGMLPGFNSRDSNLLPTHLHEENDTQQIQNVQRSNQSPQSQREANETTHNMAMDFTADANEQMPGLEHPEDDEFSIDRQVRLANEEESEANLNRRLLAPSREIQRRNRQPKRKQTNIDDLVKTLREKQLELVNLQIDLQKVLLENAKITQQECNERLLASQALRLRAEGNEHSNEE